jgi:hypothetical protein
MGWGARLLIALALILVGAAAATWALARYQNAAKVLGVTAPSQPMPSRAEGQGEPLFTPATEVPAAAVDAQRIATLEDRLTRVENVTQRAAGSAGRADALLIAFAARRAIERGVALGYLEPLLVSRFGQQHPRAVATIVTASRQPVRLNQLIADYESLGPDLRAGGPDESLWSAFQREIGSLVEVRRTDRPSVKPDARYRRALTRLQAGEVDTALVETMRLPGAARATGWTDEARRYVAARRALDEIESSALLAEPSR